MDVTDRRARIAAEAAQWWVILRADPSRDERERFVDWLRESALHVAEMMHMCTVHGALEQFERWEAVSAEVGVRDTAEVLDLPSRLSGSVTRDGPPRRFPPTSLTMAVGIAAALLATVLSWPFWKTPAEQIIQTERAERREVVLEDGSIVQVDPQTRLRVEYRGNLRHIELERGRAFFHVAQK